MKLDRLTTTGKACAGCRVALCCRSDFMVTPEEIERVRAGLTEATTALLARTHGERYGFGATDDACPFLVDSPKLGDHACAIYQDRPAACRVHGSDFPAPRCMEPTPRNQETFRANSDRLWRWIGSNERAASLRSWRESLVEILVAALRRP